MASAQPDAAATSTLLLEASELVKQIEETFGVDASAPAGGVVMAAGPAAGGAEEAAEKTEFDLVITDVDASKRIATPAPGFSYERRRAVRGRTSGSRICSSSRSTLESLLPFR